MRCLLAIVLMGAMTGCSPKAPTSKITLVDLDQAASRLAQLSGKPIRPYATRDFGDEQNTSARSVVVSAKKAEEIVLQLRKELGPGLLAFIGYVNVLAGDTEEGSEVIVALGKTQFDILRIAQSDAANYGMDTEAVIRKLKEYDDKYGIYILHADTDTIEFSLMTMPKDLRAFCDDLYCFCPDIVTQGCGSVAELEKIIAEHKVVYLWWD